MTLAELIYEKSRELPEDKAREVIDFIEFLKVYSESSAVSRSSPRARGIALAALDSFRIDFGGRPMPDREAANARD